jgi:photosystem II stability/assembly factor-like uncharacterized protein
MKQTFAFLAILLSLSSLRAQQQSSPDPNSTPTQTQSLGWVQVPIDTNLAVGIGFFSKDTAYVMNSASMYRSIDGGMTWNRRPSPIRSSFHFFNSQVGQIANYNDGICYYTSDGGQNWLPSDDSNVLVHVVLAVTRDTAFVFGDDITRTTNGGKSWTFPLKSVGHNHILGAAFFDSKHGIFVGYLQPGPPPHNEQSAGCFTTSNGGETWQQQYTGFGKDLIGVTYVSLDTIVAVAGLNCLSRSTNGGVKWDSIVSPLLDNAHGVIAIDNKNGRIIAVGSPGLILTSIDAGLTWQNEVSGVAVELLSISMLDGNRALAAGEAGVILKTTNGGTDWVQVSPPSNLNLHAQTYPEPSAGPIQISYSLPQMQNVSIMIADVTGRNIATVVDKQLQMAGSHTIPFDASRYPVGTYTYSIQTERYHATGKFTIVR